MPLGYGISKRQVAHLDVMGQENPKSKGTYRAEVTNI